MTASDDVKLFGRAPEFARMSLRPGIGAGALGPAIDAWKSFNLETTQEDVPVFLRHGNKKLPLGRYLRIKFREGVGRGKNTPEAVVKRLSEKMLDVRLRARSDSEEPSWRKKLIADSDGEVRKAKADYQLFSRKKGRI